MKKIVLTLPIVCISIWTNAQNVASSSISENNTDASISNNGTFFHVPSNGSPGYLVPKTSGVSGIYFMNLMMVGQDVNGQLKAALSEYSQSDFQPGPIADNFEDSAYVEHFSNSIWIVSQEQINAHAANWNAPGYVVPEAILTWPGNGNTANGEAAQLAPYYDSNNNGLYEPLLGDFPVIRGTIAAYSIVNDLQVHPSGSDIIGVEMHTMIYQYASDDEDLNNTSFAHVRLFNRSTQTLFDFKVGSFIDFDLGNYSDDYIGCDTTRNLTYCYNADLLDETVNGRPGHGEYPPAIGVKFLNQEMHHHYVFSALDQDSPNIVSVVQTNNIFSGRKRFGETIYDPNGLETRYMFSDISSNGWNEFTPVVNPVGDRRSIVAIEPFVFYPNSDICIDFAVLYATNDNSSLTGGVVHLQEVADEIQNFHNAQSFSCEVALNAIDEQLPEFSIYPNPANDLLSIETLDNRSFRILTSDGKTVMTVAGGEHQIVISSLAKGYYLLQSEDGQTRPFIKQ